MLNRSILSLYAGLIALMPVTILTTHGGGSALFYLLLVCAIAAWAAGWAQPAALAPYRHVIWALAAPLLIVLLAQLLSGTWNGTDLEKAGRLGAGLPLILGLTLALDPRILRQTAWGIMLAGWAATAKVLWLVYPHFERPDTQEYNAVGYSNLMILVTALSLYSLAWQLTRYPRIEKAFKGLTALVTFLGFVLTQSRSGWMAIPLFILLALALFGDLRRPWRTARLLLGAVLIAVAAGASSPTIRERASLGWQQLQECEQINPVAVTSICMRIQLWRTAWDIFRQNPWLGSGGKRVFEATLDERAQQGLVAEYVAKNFGEPHNDMLAMLASYGLAGGLALLLVYFAPAWLFLRRMRRLNPQAQRAAAAMGLALCLGFAVFGLTELMFRGMRTMGAYTVLLALFMALSDPQQERKQPHATAA